ncbi:MAG: (Fe-S)-binding protein [Nitrospirae bacterium]|nr:MAG: (Fe-S)-binding protein [Nitrospirota bacterium]
MKKAFSEGLSRKEMVELKACTQCRECLRYCPVQEVTKRIEISPSEKIRKYREFINQTEGLKGLILKKEIPDEVLRDFTEAVFECTTCGVCGEVCPVGIDTQRLWPLLRREMVRRGLGPIGSQREMPEAVSKKGNPYGKPPSERYKPWFPENVRVADRAEVAYYTGCTGAYQAQPMVRGDVLVLDAIGVPFTMLGEEEEVCCGFPLFITGQFELLESLVKRLVDAYRQRGVKRLVCSCPCCINMMTKDWPQFYGKKLPFEILHITQFLWWAYRQGRVTFERQIKERLIYHDPCYLSRGVGVIEEPRRLLRAIPGVELLEFEHHGRLSRCCGAGGAARKVYHETSVAIARLSIDEATEKGADRLVLSCPACYEKVNEAMEGYKNQIPIVDIMELIATTIKGRT